MCVLNNASFASLTHKLQDRLSVASDEYRTALIASDALDVLRSLPLLLTPLMVKIAVDDAVDDQDRC
jgi:hypothetical protein